MNYAELLESLTGKGILAFSDAAGAKSCLGLAHLLRAKNPSIQLQLLSNQHRAFYAEWSTPVEVIQQVENFPLGEGSWLFTGTSHPDSSSGFELQLIQRAQKNGLRTLSFIDHQTALVERFQLNERLVFPDQILLTNSVDLAEATKAGLPKDRLLSIEDPFKTYLREYWTSRVSAEDFRSGYTIPDTVKHIITIAPDPISLRHDLSAFGFNELTFLERFLPLIKEDSSLFFIVKTHPLQPVAPIAELLRKSAAKNVIMDQEGIFPNAEISFHSQAIIGFFSNFLVEAHILGKPIFRYLSPGEDKFERIFRNFATHCTSEEQLVQELKGYLGTCKTV